MFVTARTDDEAQLLGEVAEALRAVDIDAQLDGDVLVVDGTRLVVHLEARAHPTPADLRELVAATPARMPAMVVADRVSEAGRDQLRAAGWGWLDRRGHLRLWAPGVRIEAPAPTPGATAPGRQEANPWTTVGLEIAVAALLEPDEPLTARRVAPRIGRSVGATHELIARFRSLGLVGPRTHQPLLPELFWETAARWPDGGWVAVPVPLTEVADRVGAEQLVRVDERAATLGGARIAAAGDLPPRCYVRSPSALRRVRALTGPAVDEERGPDERPRARCWIREAPVQWLPLNEAHQPDDAHPWQVAHPIVCALRLAADPARGREIVDDWGIVPGGG